MSPSMILGRLLLPGAGLALLAVLIWQAARPAQPGSARAATSAPDRPSPGREATPPRLIVAEGRVVTPPGGMVAVASEVLGRIVSMPVAEGARVRQGDLLAELRSDEARAALKEARAHLAEAEAELLLPGRTGLARLLFPPREGLPELLAAPPEANAARARRDAAQAAVERVEAQLAAYRLVAPIDGEVVAVHAHAGEVVQPAAPIVTVADLRRLRVEAEVDEFDIGQLALGAEARINAEGSPHEWLGRVERIADAVLDRRLRPEDPSRPTDARVLPVRIVLDASAPLTLGRHVEVRIGFGPPASSPGP